ncbi:hypothetical protein [Enterococcus sp. AZ196]|uniref:hypothetical protein n=1 Tax=Enterococcus sp. AZ196 TaxID=2774659 RepID=UPI003D2AF1FE
MHRVMTDSKKYKVLIRRFTHEKRGKQFTYKEFIHWLTDRQYLIVSHCGNASIGQAIFTTITNHEFELVTTYRHSEDGQLETVYQIENDEVNVSKTDNEPVSMETSTRRSRGGMISELYRQ